MPVPTGGLLKVRLQYNSVGQACENVFYYWNSLNVEPASFAGLIADFNLKVVDKLALIQSTDVTYNFVVMSTVLGTLPDFPGVPTQADGDLLGERSTSFQACQFRLNRTTKDTRNGAKRFAGLTEDFMAGNFVTSAYETLMETFAPQLALPLVSTNTYDPVIFSPVKPTRPTLFVNLVDSVSAITLITSQRSRKRK